MKNMFTSYFIDTRRPK